MVLALVKGTALSCLLVLVVAGGLNAAALSPQPGATAQSGSYQRVVERAVADHHCSYADLGARVVPAALIRTADGTLRQVSFDIGWEIYNGKLPGTLVAVCLDRAGNDGLSQVSS